MDRSNASEKLSYEPMTPGDDASYPENKQATKNRTEQLLMGKVAADTMELQANLNSMISRQYLEALNSLAFYVEALSSLKRCGSQEGDIRALESVKRIDSYIWRVQLAEESMTSDQRLRLAEAHTLRTRHVLDGKVRRAEELMTLDEVLAFLQARDEARNKAHNKELRAWMKEQKIRMKELKFRTKKLRAPRALNYDDSTLAEESKPSDQRLARLQARTKELKARLALEYGNSEQAFDSLTLDQSLALLQARKKEIRARNPKAYDEAYRDQVLQLKLLSARHALNYDDSEQGEESTALDQRLALLQARRKEVRARNPKVYDEAYNCQRLQLKLKLQNARRRSGSFKAPFLEVSQEVVG